MYAESGTLPAKATRRSVIKYFDGDFYTRYLAKSYDRATTLTGWRAKLKRYAFDGVQPCKMLDVGCGTGFIMNLARQAGFEVIGVDPSEGMLKKARAEYGFSPRETFKSTADKLPFHDESFDFVFAAGSMEYVPNPEETAVEMNRVLRRGGVIRIIDHGPPRRKNILTPFVYLYTHASGHLIHDYEYYFSKHGRMIRNQTLGRGGYMQLYDFKKV